MNHNVTITVRSENAIPNDVLVEHIAVALRDLKFLGKYDIIDVVSYTSPEADMTRNHPFDGPEVFDDEPKPLATGGYVSGTHGESSFTATVAPRETVLTKEQIQALGAPIYPYPLATEAAFQLREARRAQSDT